MATRGQWCFRKGYGGMCKRTVLLENQFLIRINSRGPGPHILVKQHMTGTGSEPFAFSWYSAMIVATRFSVVTVCFFSFRSTLLTVRKSFYHLATFLLQKQDSPTPPNPVAKLATAKTAWQSTATSGRLAAVSPLPPLREIFCLWLHQHVPTPPLEAKPPLSYHLGSGRRLRKCTARSYRTPCGDESS